MSDAPGSLAAALAQLQARLPRVGKSETATVRSDKGSYKYSYATLTEISAALLPLMAQLGLSFTASPTLMALNGELKFVLHYQLIWAAPEGEEAERLDGMYPLGTGTPQQLGSAISYARRYCLMAITGLAPDDGSDDDAQAAEQSYRDMRNRPPETRTDGSATEAEIMRMQRGPEPGTERLKAAPDDDPFYDPSPVPPEERPGSVTRQQHIMLARVLKARGCASDEEARAECARRIGQPVQSRGQLSWVQAKAIIEWKEPAGASEPANAS